MNRRSVSRFVFAAACAGWGVAPAAFAQSPAPVFEPQTIDDAIKIGYGLAIGDVDGDGKPDILLADKTDIVWYRNPDWQKHVIVSRLSLLDNVCLAARDLDGDGKVEIAVGAQWNPGETSDEAKSGGVFYLLPPADRTQRWTPVKLPHEPTTHRMKWLQVGEKEFRLLVVPLHGRGNHPGQGTGAPVKVLAYRPPADPSRAEDWTIETADASLHKTHNFDVRKSRSGVESFWLGGMEGVRLVTYENGAWKSTPVEQPGLDLGVGEIRGAGSQILAVIQPMHGNQVAVYHDDDGRTVLDTGLASGHALVCQPLRGGGFPDIAAGWREPDAAGKVGIKLYVRDDTSSEENWETHVIDDNHMACEDLAAADLDGDGKPELIAAGRATHNVIIYWNKTDFGPAPDATRPELPPLTDEEKARLKARQEERAKAEEPD